MRVSMSSGNRPVHEIRLGRIRASVWTNESTGQDVWFNVSISRLYRDGNEWKTTTSFGRDDLPLVAKAAEMAYAWIWNTKGQHHVGT
jgi:hypothetical protein